MSKKVPNLMFSYQYVLLTSVVKGGGLGNLRRSEKLLRQFNETDPTLLLVYSNMRLELNGLFEDSKHIKTISSFNEVLHFASHARLIVMDVGFLEISNLLEQLRLTCPNLKIVGLDYFNDNSNFDLRISLFDQKEQTFYGTNPKHLVGLEFAVLSSAIKARIKNNNKVIIRLSGTKNSNLLTSIQLAKEALEKAGYRCILFNHTNIESRNFIYKQADFIDLITTSSLFLGSGATTLLQCAYIKTGCVFVPANDYELNFARALEAIYKDVLVAETPTKILEYTNMFSSTLIQTDSFVPKVPLDDKGASRIKEECLKL